MFTAFFAGASLVVTGSIGYNVHNMHGTFQGGLWVDGPIWWQITLGGALLLLAAYWSRRLEPDPTLTPPPRHRIIKNVGRGKTSGANQRQERQSLASGTPKT